MSPAPIPEIPMLADNSDYLLQFFAYKHLPANLQAASKPFGDLARTLVDTLPRNPERSTAIRRLLEAKDCAVRALLFKVFAAEGAIRDGETFDDWMNRGIEEARARGETV
jgi:hypothetical protein